MKRPITTPNDDLLKAFLARGGVVTRCPSAFSAPAGAVTTAEHQSAIRSHEAAREERRRQRYAVRKGFAHGQAQRTPGNENGAVSPSVPADRGLSGQEADPSPPQALRPFKEAAKMTSSNMWHDFKSGQKETFQKITHEDGRSTWYFTDKNGREWFSLFGRNNQFQGTYKVERPGNG